MIETRYHETVNVLQELLEDGSARNVVTPFERPEWYALLVRTGLSPLVVTAKGSDARGNDASAALVLTEVQGTLSPMRNWYNFTWRAFAKEGPSGDELLSEIARKLKSRTHRVTFEPVPDEEGSATQLALAMTNAGWRVEVTQCDTNHVLHVNGRSFEEYWQSRPGPLRTTLKRKGKKVETQIISHFDAPRWEAFEAIYQASWKPDEDHPAMLRAFAQQEGAAARLRLGVALHEGKPAAAQFWTVEGGTAYIHKLAHLDSSQKLSAGTTLTAALFQHVIDHDKVETVDFGTGTQSYKSDWMEETRPRYRLDCLNMSRPRSWLDLARLTARRLTQPDVPALAPTPPRG